MSKAVLEDIKCCKCGADAQVMNFYSYSSFPSNNLNYYLSMKRVRNYPRTEVWEVRKCENCGYLHHNLSIDTGLDLDFYKNLTTDDIIFKSEHCVLLYKYYKVLRALKDYEQAYQMLESCLEECDYVGDKSSAYYCMMKMEYIYENTDTSKHILMQVDVLRRLGLFEKMKSFVGRTIATDKSIRENEMVFDVLKYQIYLADNYKDGSYTLSDMVEWKHS